MSIEGILRKLGHDAPREVLPDGRLKIGPRASGLAGLPLTKHTFHGGSSLGDAGKVRWWLDGEMVEKDRIAMSAYFPGFSEIPGDDTTPPGWFGVIDTGRGRFPVLVQHRWDHRLPRVVPVGVKRRTRRSGRRVEFSPHVYTNGELCVAAQEDWDPERDSIATVVAWTAHWHAVYVEWFAGGKWATEGYLAA